MADMPAFGVYIHWPYCRRICPYCDFNVYKARGDDQALADAILADLHHWRQRLGPRPLTSLHFGGGTPSLLPPTTLAKMIDQVCALFPPLDNLEIGLEANPTDHQSLAEIRQAGIERLSLGLQALNDPDLKRLGRDHGVRQGLAALEDALVLFPRVSVDLITAREGQTPTQWHAELQDILRYDLDHLSVYGLTIEPGTAFARQQDRGDLIPPDDETASTLYDITVDTLRGAGFTHYEVSNFARHPAAQSRHNRLYWQSDDWLGLGPGAHGRLTLDGQRLATETHLQPKPYVEAVSTTGTGSKPPDPLSDTDQALEALIMGLRLDEGVEAARLHALAIDPKTLRQLAEEGLVDGDLFTLGRGRGLGDSRLGGRLRLTGRGRRLLDHVLLRLTA